MHPVAITLHPEVNVSVTINVARSIEEAKIQEKTGTIVINDKVEANPVDELIEELDGAETNMPSETEADDQARAAKTLAGTDESSIDDNSDGASEDRLKPGTEKSE